MGEHSQESLSISQRLRHTHSIMIARLLSFCVVSLLVILTFCSAEEESKDIKVFGAEEIQSDLLVRDTREAGKNKNSKKNNKGKIGKNKNRKKGKMGKGKGRKNMNRKKGKSIQNRKKGKGSKKRGRGKGMEKRKWWGQEEVWGIQEEQDQGQEKR